MGGMMTYEHSFTHQFYGDVYNPSRSSRPTTVADALASMSDDEWSGMIQDLFPDAKSESIGLEQILAMVLETNTVSSLQPPVEVWIDREGVHMILVHDASYPISRELFERQRNQNDYHGK